MAGFLDSFGKSSGGTDVYVAVSATNRIEIATLGAGGRIDNYAQADLDYNEAQREITSYQDFKNKLADLMNQCNINPQKANIYLSLPTVWFGYKDNIPLILDNPAVTNVIMGDLEQQSYIFKRKDAVPFWFDAMVSTNSDTRSVFYTALQKDVKENLQNAITDLGATLVGIDCSTFANLRALLTTGIAAEQMESPGYSWSLMVVNSNGYQLFGLQNKKILEYYEEAIPIKSFEGDGVYSAIDSSAQISLLSSPSNALVIVSETDLVSAEILAKNIQFTGVIIPVEDNKFKKAPFVDLGLNIVPENQIKVSLHLLGLVSDKNVLPVQLNFLEAAGEKAKPVAVIEIPITEGVVIVLTPQKATKLAAAFFVLILILVGLGIFIPSSIEESYTSQNATMQSQLEQVNAELKKYESEDTKTNFNAEKEIENVLKNNRTKVMAYAALGETIPRGLYLTYFMTGDNGIIDIQGCANTVEDVYIFFQNLKDSLIEAKLRLNKLDLKAGSLDTVINSSSSAIDNAPYVFEITNMDDTQLQSFMNALKGITETEGEGEGSENANGQKPQQAQDASQPQPQPQPQQ